MRAWETDARASWSGESARERGWIRLTCLGRPTCDHHELLKKAAREAPKSRGDRSARTRAHGSRALPNTQTESIWISSSESCLWQGSKHLLTWSVIVSSFPIHTHTQCGPWRQKDLRMFPRHIYLYLQVFVIEWRHLTEVIKPKFGVFDTHASTTGRTKNVPIALFSAASRVAFDKGTVYKQLEHVTNVTLWIIHAPVHDGNNGIITLLFTL